MWEVVAVLAIIFGSIACLVLLIAMCVGLMEDGFPSAEEFGESVRHLGTAPARFWRGFCGPEEEPTKPPKPRSAVE